MDVGYQYLQGSWYIIISKKLVIRMVTLLGGGGPGELWNYGRPKGIVCAGSEF